MLTQNDNQRKLERALQSFIGKVSKEKTDTSLLELLSNRLLMIKTIEEGIPFSIFAKILDLSPFPIQYWSDALDLSLKSLQRYSQTNRRFDPIHSEKIIELAEVIEFGKNVFGDNQKLKLWLETPNFALGKLRPMDLLKYSYGKEMVLTELGRIENGILA
jgi:putative toxin-antitoxin system antitoxin component (TIGR02293 family)